MEDAGEKAKRCVKLDDHRASAQSEDALHRKRRVKALRIPLHVKLMVSYLLVVSLVFVPTVIYLSTIQRAEIRAAQVRELRTEAELIGERLTRTQDIELAATVAFIVDLLPQRITVTDHEGRVLGDSVTAGQLENHAHHPEVRAALATGLGIEERVSETTGKKLLYVAARYPRLGQPQGVVRLSVPMATIDERGRKGTLFLNRSGAVALSAALLLSLFAALVVSRPLRRIADGARAFAAGDFGHPLDVTTQDELGEAARALEDLGAQLRDRLVTAGADRATLHALCDELPIGVILYDSRLVPVLVNGPARVLCGFDIAHELTRAQEIPQMPEHAQAVRHVLEHGDTIDLPLQTPWSNPPSVTARWLVVHASNGVRQPALLVLDRSAEARQSVHVNALRVASDRLYEGARALGDTPLGARLRRAADDTEWLVPRTPPRPVDVEALSLATILSGVLDDLEAARQRDVELSLDDEHIAIVEAGGRTRRTVREFIRAALEQIPAGEALALSSESAGAHVRLGLRTPNAPRGLSQLANDLRPLGGDGGSERDGDATESWLLLPRA